MRGQPSVCSGPLQQLVWRPAARIAPPRSLRDASYNRKFIPLLWIVASLGCFWISGAANAQAPVIAIDNELINDTRITSGLLVAGPPEVARDMAIVDSAMFDAANAASGLAYTPVAYAGPAVSGVSADAAALSAGYTALQTIFANNIWSGTGGDAALQSTVLTEINATFAAGLNSLGITQANNIPNLSACSSPSSGLVSVCGGIALGTTAGNANLTARGYTVGNNAALATDGSATAILNGISNPYVPANKLPGTYIPTSSRVAMFPEWGTVAPSGLTGSQMTALVDSVPGPPSVTTSAIYANNVLQTECQGAGSVLPANIQSACAAAGFTPETTAEAKAALFWNDPGTTYQPPGHWLSITDDLALSQGLSTLKTALLTSLVSQAENNAGIAAWAVKYKFALWRPVTAIRDCNVWNPNFTTCDPTWTSLIATPPHPDYVAGHPAFSGAAATVLDNFFNTDNIPVVSTSDAYCNGGTQLRGTPTGPIIACVVTPTSTTGLQFLFNNAPTIYGPASACATLGGTLVSSGGNPVSCTIDGVTYFFNPSEFASGNGCNDIVIGGANDSPLICPITESFPTISDASSGPNGSEFSRVVGGIHTPLAVVDALNLGNAIGEAVASDNNIPEPEAIGLLAISIGLLAGARRFRPARAMGRAAFVRRTGCLS
jgi:hypothetical protein